MVWSRGGGQVERPPLSAILPQLYLGAESDVTQDQLASLGISYVLSVSRCSPQPPFLPGSRYLRIPIDDSLKDDLLPWIPRALQFIDGAVSSGASVLLHCAAGVSRSPALAVAYIMYSLHMDLDHAYRFVKERRPSISPNFNFLGQLQHLQGALSQRSRDHQLQQLASCSPPVSDGAEPSVSRDNQLLWTLDLPLHQNRQAAPHPSTFSASSSSEPVNPAPKTTQLLFPSGTASLLEKRKSLTLSLTPLGMCPPSTENSHQQTNVQSRKMEERPEAKTQSHPGPHRQAGDAHRQAGDAHRQAGVAHRQAGDAHRQAGVAHRQAGDAHRSLSCMKNSRAEVKEKGLLAPFSFTLSRLLGWGEKVLLGGVFVGPPTLPYRC